MIDCLTYAEDIAVLFNDLETAQKSFEEVQVTAKTSDDLQLEERKMEKVKIFKYLGERIQENELKKKLKMKKSCN